MTPERLNEYADWLMDEGGFGPTPEEKEIAAFLRECAKAEPKVAPTVAIDERAEFEKWWRHFENARNVSLFDVWQARAKLPSPQQQPFSLLKSSPASYSANASDAPQVFQPESVPDEIETAHGLDEQSEYAKGWNDCLAEILKVAK